MSRLFPLVLLFGCSTPPEETAQAPAPVPFVAPPFAGGGPHAAPLGLSSAKPAARSAGRQGKVLETMDSGGYTYARVDLCGEESWVAGPLATVAVGQTLVLKGGTPMTGFNSKTLDRTFDSILFASKLDVSSSPPDCSGTTAAAPAPAAAPHSRPTPAGGTRQGKVLETMMGGGYRYARVDFCGTESWIAGPAAEVAVGQTIETGAGATMQDFPSSTLGRTFDRIDFVGGIKTVPGEPTCG